MNERLTDDEIKRIKRRLLDGKSTQSDVEKLLTDRASIFSELLTLRKRSSIVERNRFKQQRNASTLNF